MSTDYRQLTMAEGFIRLIERLDAAYQKLRAIHTDEAYLNFGTPDYKKAQREFNDAEDAVWTFKEVWDTLK